MKIKVPKQIQVGGHWYKIVFDKSQQPDGHAATTVWRKQRIEIDPALPESGKVESLGHEIIHIINQVYMHQDLREQDVDPLSEGLYQVFSQLDIELDWSEIETIEDK